MPRLRKGVISPTGFVEGVGPVLDGDRDLTRSRLGSARINMLRRILMVYLLFWPVALCEPVTFLPQTSLIFQPLVDLP